MNENWSRPKGAELDENIAALRRARVIAWAFLALTAGGLCLLAGFIVGRFGG